MFVNGQGKIRATRGYSVIQYVNFLSRACILLSRDVSTALADEKITANIRAFITDWNEQSIVPDTNNRLHVKCPVKQPLGFNIFKETVKSFVM